MQKTLQIKSQFLHLENNLFLNPFLEAAISIQSFKFSSKSPIFSTTLLLSRKTQIQKPVICARKSKRKYGSEKSTFMLELISFLSSNLKILPQPLDLVVQNLVGGDGGIKLLNGLKGGSFNGWRTTATRRRRNGKKIIGFLAILGSCILCLVFGKELNNEVLFGVLGFGFFVLALIQELRRGLKDWVFRFCCIGILIAFGLRGNEAMKWIKETRGFSSSSPMVEIVRRGKRRGR